MGASANPSAGLLPRLPIAVHVPLACANPANEGLVGSVLGAARVLVGGQMRCFAQAIGYQKGSLGPKLMVGPTGLGPAQIQSAYKLAGLTPPTGATVALVDAYNDPHAASDLAKFRSTYGLPPCTVANGCFKQVNQNGAKSPLPSGDYGWSQVGGTSLSSPLIASVYALAGNSWSVNYGSYSYSHTSSLFDVTSGSDGTCSPTYLCTAGPGYDGPTGNGTPDGTGAF